MAHTCPICGATCRCNGDINDICLDLEEDINACTCCDDLDALDDDFEYDDGDGEAEPVQLPKLGCKCAKRTDEWHGWECEITGGACVFLYPSSEACAREYGEGPDADRIPEEEQI